MSASIPRCGCFRHLQPVQEVKPLNSTGNHLDDVEKIEHYRRELEALKKIDSEVYNKRKAEFYCFQSISFL